MTTTISKLSISAVAAARALSAAMTEAKRINVPAVVSIVDESGQLKLMSRMDNAPLLSIQIAYTSVAFGLATHEWHEFIKDDPPLLHGIVKTPRLIIFGGGYPLKVGEQIVGGIGVSGGHCTDDMKIAEAGIAAFNA